MYRSGFSLTILEGLEDSSGYVALKHRQKYTIRLGNQTSRRADVDLNIDGKLVGTFRVNAWQNVVIERPVNEDGRFTFYKTNSSEAESAGINLVARSDRGLVEATFKPEKYESSVVKPISYTGIRGQSTKGWVDSDTEGRIASSDFLMASPASMNFDSGGTGLSGQSNQKFVEVQNLNYDIHSQTTLTVRLVCKKKPVVRPLTDVRRVPAPVD